MYLVVINRCIECGDELELPYTEKYGLLCPICLAESANFFCEKGVMN